MKNLAPIIEQLKMSQAKFVAAAEKTPAELWRKVPGGGKWSVCEVVAHVTMVEQSVIARAKKSLLHPPVHVSFFHRIHLPLTLIPWRVIKRETPIPLDPQFLAERPEAIDRLTETRESTLDFIRSTSDQNLAVYRFQHPFLGSLNMYDWFTMIAYHELRHAKQILDVVEIFHR